MAEETTRRVDDAGAKIGGARKDWRDRVMSVDDLSDLTNDEAVLAVRKDAVWPQPDWTALVEAGLDPKVAALGKILRDRMAQTPTPKKSDDPAEFREGFVKMTAFVRDLVMSSKTPEDLSSIYSKAIAHSGGLDAVRRNDSPEARAFFSIYKARSTPIAIHHEDVRKANKMLQEGFPAKAPAWRKGLRAVRERAGTWYLVKGSQIVKDGFETEAAAFSWAEKKHEDDAKARKSGKKDGPVGPVEPRRPHLDVLERVGLPDRRQGGDVSPDDFIATFGFRGVEFGNWLPDGERQKVLNIAYDSLLDLADVLGWEPNRLGLGGRLAVAFGARGNGSAAAHYEAGRTVVNMTRINGAGSVAHEYAHAFDHFAGEVNATGSSADIRSGTGWRTPTRDRAKDLENLSPDAAGAWDALMKALGQRQVLIEEAIADAVSDLQVLRGKIQYYRNYNEEQSAVPVGQRNTVSIRRINQWLAEQAPYERAKVARLERLQNDPGSAVLPRKPTDYVENAKRLSGKSGDYWVRPNELFARAFESWVYDRLDAAGAKSDYLVHGVEPERYADGKLFKGNPYPVGGERAAFAEAITDLVRTMTPHVDNVSEPEAAPSR